ncbi:MAG: CvpA family protein [Muribaculum sp.]|nr:CvpA family protein [Muribaculum sp.]
MSVIDIILIIVLAVSIIYGAIKGLISQIASLGGIIGGIIACRLLGPATGDWLMELMPHTFSSPTTARIAGYILLFLLVYFTIGAIASLARKFTKAILLGWLDHLLGAVFSCFKWLLIVSIILNLWHMVWPEATVFHSSTLMDGDLFPAIMKLAPATLGFAIDQLNTTVNGLT